MRAREAVAVAQQVTIHNIVLDLPVGNNCGIVFTGTPPQVAQITAAFPNLPVGDNQIIGYYFSSLRFPGCEISNITDTTRLNVILASNQDLPRQVVLTSHRPFSTPEGCRYAHGLPAQNWLGVTFEGFPPRVKSVDQNSPLAGKTLPGQFVQAIKVPGRDDLSTLSGGFTSLRISDHLQETSSIPGRCIVLSDRSAVPPSNDNRRDESAAFDPRGCVMQ